VLNAVPVPVTAAELFFKVIVPAGMVFS